MIGEVEAKDWYRAGFSDGLHGNPKWPPTGDMEARKEYLKGYAEGRKSLGAYG